MKLAYSPYELRSKEPLGKSASAVRRGALLRIEHPGRGYGYADCHPWPELGDEPLERQLALLAQGKPTPLTERSLALARVDAEFRAAGRSAFSSTVPESHVLVGNASALTKTLLEHWAFEGLRVLKVKASTTSDPRTLRDLSVAAADRQMKLRIDFNESLSIGDAVRFFDVLCSNDGARGIDFIEDPVPFKPEDWTALKRKFPIRLALDRAASTTRLSAEALDVFVLKPAIQDPEHWIPRLRGTPLKIVITSYLDHPLGTAGAAWHAMRVRQVLAAQLEPCGLMTHLNYAETPFSRRIERDGARWVAPEGRGFGFDEELERLEWMELR